MGSSNADMPLWQVITLTLMLVGGGGLYLWRLWTAREQVALRILYFGGFGCVVGAVYWLIDLVVDLDPLVNSLPEFVVHLLILLFVPAALVLGEICRYCLEDWALRRLRRKYGGELPPLDEAR